MDYRQEGNRVICGRARFSALSNGLVRLEWSATQQFEDHPTVQALTRPEAVPFEAIATEDDKLILLTSVLRINYRPDQQPFNDDNLQIDWCFAERSGTWTPSIIDTENLGGTFTSLDVIHRNFHPQGVHPAGVDCHYPQTETWLYQPLISIHKHLRSQGETTQFEDPPLWYLAKHRPEDLPPADQETLQTWKQFPPGLLSRSGYRVLNDSGNSLVIQGNLAERVDPEGLDWYFFAYGDQYTQALQDFVKLCDRIPMLPRWAFGIWFSAFDDLQATDYHRLIHHFQENDLPLDVLLLDINWHQLGWCGWDWNTEFFPDPPAFLNELHELGLHVGANIHPEGVPPDDSHFQTLCEARGLDADQVKAGKIFAIQNPTAHWIFETAPRPNGIIETLAAARKAENSDSWLLFNLAQPDDAKLLMEVLHHPHEQAGIDFWWMDGANADHPGVNNQLWTNHVYFTDQETQHNRRGLILSRAGGVGSHRYPVQFSGDTYSHWEVLQFQVDFTARAGNLGVAYWSHDIGGFFNHAPGVPSLDPELFVRWVQFGCWSPIVRLHSDHGQREPWAYGYWALDAIRQAFQTRVQFVPYLYHLSRVAHDTGLPLCRPLYLHYPHDPAAYQTQAQYLLGDAVLVAPVVEAGGARSLYLPEGQWWERSPLSSPIHSPLHAPLSSPLQSPAQLHTGAQWLHRYFKLAEVPVFVKAGAILPLQPVTLRVGTTPPDRLILEVYAGASGELDFYEDDGESLDYRTQSGSRRYLKHWQEGDRATLACDPMRGSYQGMPAQRRFQICWIGLPADSQITAIGVEIQQMSWVENYLEIHLEPVAPQQSWHLVAKSVPRN